VTTLTKRMAEEMTEYLLSHEIRAAYIHSDVATLDRIQIMNDLRAGLYDVLVGVNLLREGLDLPEVSLVAILDADKEGFLRSHRSLTQTAGRAARNVEGKVIMYADTITQSMRQTIDETMRRRSLQMKYNADHGITPRQIVKAIAQTMPHGKKDKAAAANAPATYRPYIEPEGVGMVADPVETGMTSEQIARLIVVNQERMKEAASKLDFMQAAQFRDEVARLQNLLDLKGAE